MSRSLSSTEYSRQYREAMTALRETHEAEYQRILAAIRTRDAAKRSAPKHIQSPLMSAVSEPILEPYSPDRRELPAQVGPGQPRSIAWRREAQLREWHRIELPLDQQAAALGVCTNTIIRVRRELGLRWRVERRAS